jgi:hypothetical protein
MYSSPWMQELTSQAQRKLMASNEDFAWLSLQRKGQDGTVWLYSRT